MMATSAHDVIDFSDCQEYTDDDLNLLDSLSYFVEGVMQTPIAICGLVCNLATCIVLASKVLNNFVVADGKRMKWSN